MLVLLAFILGLQPRSAAATLVPINDQHKWRFENTGKDLGTAWKEKNFDDSAWPEGVAVFGLDSGATTEPIRTALSRTSPEGGNIITDYFRTHFNFTGDPASMVLKLRHYVDDGLVVYLNGTEIHRFGVADGAPFDSTSTFSDHEGRNILEGPFTIPTTALVSGDNVLAVEVHQSSAGSSDVVFALELMIEDAPPPSIETTLIAIDDQHKWRYENTGTDLGTAWKESSFNDSSWPEGVALFAAESGATTVPIRTTLVRTGPAGAIVTDYFRTHFNFTGDPSVAKLRLRHYVDDGLVVYLNGTEVHRFGIPAGTAVTSTTTATSHEGRNIFDGPFDIPSSALVAGDNVIAVEVHQQDSTSSDAVFALELIANTPIPTEPEPEPNSKKIAWVSFHADDNTPSAAAATAGFTKAPDVGYTDLLKANGYDVTRIRTSGTPDAALLNTFDLVIVSRSVPSGDYETAAETAAWNGITSPMILMGGYILRANRLGFTSGNGIPDTAGSVRLAVNEPAHPIFRGIALDTNNTTVNIFADRVSYTNNLQRGISVNTNAVTGNGKVLATVGTAEDPAAGGMIIGEWEAGATLSRDQVAGRRMVFLSGSREASGLTSEGAGIYDLSADGAQLFLNAVKHMTTTPPIPRNIAWVSFHPADETPSADAATAGFTRAPDAGYTDLLESAGHTVTRIVTSGTPDVSRLNTFDLVIVSRSVPSGDYETAAETAAWNGITAPTMIMGGYILRSNRLGFTTGTGIPDTINPVRLTVTDPGHPIFEGISLGTNNTTVNVFAEPVTFNGTVQRGISVNTNSVTGNGKVLATVGTGDPAAGGMIIGEWDAGAQLGRDTLGGRRLVFLSGSREASGLTSQGAGIYDLSADGAQLFLNAVDYIAAVPSGVTAQADSAETDQDKAVSIPGAKLTVNDTGGTLTVSAVSAASGQGGTVALANGMVTYTPKAGFVGADTFTYTVANQNGGTATGTVNVTVLAANLPSQNLVAVTRLDLGVTVVQFVGIPGRSYRVQASSDLQTWTDVGTATANSRGAINFIDLDAPNFAQRFYRTVAPTP